VPPVEPSGPPSVPDPSTLDHPAEPPGVARRRRGVAVGAVVVVVLLIVATLFWLGAFSGPPAAALPATPAYAAALGAANSAARGAPGGPWTTVAGAGLALTSSFTGPAASISSAVASLTGCTFGWVGTPPTAVTFPQTPASAVSGSAGVWAFISVNSTDTAAMVTLVINSTATALFTLSGETCSSGLTGVSAIPGNVVDSTTAAASADRAGGSAFLANHTAAERSYEIVATGGVFSLAIWQVVYSTCSPVPGNSSTGMEFSVTEDAASGLVVGPGTTQTVSCASTPFG